VLLRVARPACSPPWGVEGADVGFAYLPEEELDAAQVAGPITAEGRRVLKLPGDIKDEGFCGDLVARTIDELGGLDILVSNAGG
jgi:NAD(P)-dependent dehydrogenase (short-subunit alcohol dehydrogenase family)